MPGSRPVRGRPSGSCLDPPDHYRRVSASSSAGSASVGTWLPFGWRRGSDSILSGHWHPASFVATTPAPSPEGPDAASLMIDRSVESGLYTRNRPGMRASPTPQPAFSTPAGARSVPPTERRQLTPGRDVGSSAFVQALSSQVEPIQSPVDSL
jgi:hypothetical protein